LVYSHESLKYNPTVPTMINRNPLPNSCPPKQMNASLIAVLVLIGIYSHVCAQRMNAVLWRAERVHYTLGEIKPYWAWIIQPADGGDTNCGSFKTTVDGIFRSDPTPLIEHVWLTSVNRDATMQKEVMDHLKDTVVLRKYPTRHGANGRMCIDGTENPISVEMCRLFKSAILETSLVREMDEALLPHGLHIGRVSTEKLCIFAEKGVYHWEGFTWLMIERAEQSGPRHESQPSRSGTNRTSSGAGSRR
jgi:hypothetical protein